MRRIAILGAVVALSLSLVGEASGAQYQRKETRPYDAPSGIVLDSPRIFWSLPGIYGAEFVAKPGDEAVTIDLEDRSSLTAMAYMEIDRNYDGTVEIASYFCDTSKTMKVRPGTVIRVWPVSGICEDGTPSAPVRGVISASFSR